MFRYRFTAVCSALVDNLSVCAVSPKTEGLKKSLVYILSKKNNSDIHGDIVLLDELCHFYH